MGPTRALRWRLQQPVHDRGRHGGNQGDAPLLSRAVLLPFEDVFYAPPRFLLVALDTVALLRTALDTRDLGWLQESAALAELERSSAMLLRTLGESFPGHDRPPRNSTRPHERWSQRYARAVVRMRDAGIPTRADQESGLREYGELRARWEPAIEGLAGALGWRMEEVDRAGCSDRPHGQGS